MELNKWFEKGMTPISYIEQMNKLKENSLHIYENFTPPADEDFFQSLKERNLRVIVIAEEWCGHCMLDIPVLLRLTEKIDMPVRFLLRDDNLELMDQYLTNGKSRTIPIFIFIDEDGNEVAKWGPIANYVKQFVDKHKVKLPSKDADDYQEKFTEMIKFMSDSFRDHSDFWDEVYKSIKEALE